MAENYDDLKERLDNPPLSWTPNGVPDGLDEAKCLISSEIFGRVEEIEERDSDFGPFKMVTVLDPGGRRVQIAGLGTVLGKRFRNLEVGQRVAVRYTGRKPSSVSGQEDYHDYEVAIGK